MGGNIEVIPQSASSRFPAVAYDSVSDSYLVVTGVAKVSARFVSAAGVPLGPADSINNAGPGATGVACSAAANACLVAWIQEPTTIMGRLLRSNGGELQYLTTPFPISTSRLPSSRRRRLASRRLLRVSSWSRGRNWCRIAAIKGQRVTSERRPRRWRDSCLASPHRRFHAAVSDLQLGAGRVRGRLSVRDQLDGEQPRGAAAGEARNRRADRRGAIIYSGPFAQYPEIAYNSTDNQYLAITWGGLVITGGLADGTGQSLTGGVPHVIAANGIGDGIGLAYNPVSNTYLAVYLSTRQPGDLGRRGEQDRSPRRSSSS